ncbi:hypothetical protein [Chryseobacterium kwangjuense]|uniref:Uncharacterized protein n=1 Tax=Chryseobacterium kwangjuense TaxID=267125 RepID=A0A135WDK8_9FLAO|nr:hypothetical protein [Chryseobacterium kwangjuense]KXH82967.1 hypothetical protein AU378_11050 [Chryseobacterium kwangjuense]
MKNIWLIFVLISNTLFSQELEIIIPEDKVIKFGSYENTSFCYDIRNKSNNYYKILFETAGFSTTENETIDFPYVGLADLRVYNDQKLLTPNSGSDALQKKSKEVPTRKELMLFRKDNKLKTKDISELNLLYKINKRMITLSPNETKAVCTNISLPLYNSSADIGSLLYEIKNDKEYMLQLHLNIPKEILRKYLNIFKNQSKKYKIFSGTLISNKVSFILTKENVD